MTTAAALPRCTFKGCPVRYRTGPDHPCADHGADQWAVSQAAEELGIELAPGDRGAADGAPDGAAKAAGRSHAQ